MSRWPHRPCQGGVALRVAHLALVVSLQNPHLCSLKIVWPATHVLPVASDGFLRKANLVRVPGWRVPPKAAPRSRDAPRQPKSCACFLGAAAVVWMPLRSSWCHVGRPEGLDQQPCLASRQLSPWAVATAPSPYTGTGSVDPGFMRCRRASDYNLCRAPFDSRGPRTPAYFISTLWLAS
jgi:hypothetical protein